MVPIVVTAKLFGQRPSTLAAIADPVLALEFDLAAGMIAARMQKEEYTPPAERERLCL